MIRWLKEEPKRIVGFGYRFGTRRWRCVTKTEGQQGSHDPLVLVISFV